MAGQPGPSGPTEIEELLKQAQSPSAAGAKPIASAEGITPGSSPMRMTPRKESSAQGEIDDLLNEAEQVLARINGPSPGETPEGIKPFKLVDFTAPAATAETAPLDLIRDVELDLRIELGRTHMHLEDVLKLSRGSVVTLDKLAGDPVDIFVNGRLIARGEVLILNENFCVRVAELVVGETSARQVA